MQDADPSLKNISDTAFWVAACRARESARPDAVFRDPFASRLAGRRGMEIADGMAPDHAQEWAFTARTHLFDKLISTVIAAGADTVVNLAAGLDARPYRMDLPTGLRWVEVDLPQLLEYKDQVLCNETPRCRLERVPLDLSDRAARQALFQRIGEQATHVLSITEGLLIYLEREAVADLARDLAGPRSFHCWVVDVVSPGLLRMMMRQMGKKLQEAELPFRFAPAEGPGFYAHYGWKASECHSVFKAGRRLRRLPFFLGMLAMLPEPKRPQPNAVWQGICLLTR